MARSAQAKISILGDPSGAMRAFAAVQTGAGNLTRSLAGVGTKGSGVFKGLAASIAGSGLLPGLGPIQQGLLGMAGAFDMVEQKGKSFKAGKVLMGAGVGLAVAGGIGLQLAKPLEDAQAQLKQSVANAGVDWSQVSKPISSQQKQMEHLGFTYADTDQALALLTQGLGSPQKALQQLTLDANLAARSHSSLTDQATTVVKAYAKSPMVLRQFGINLSDTTKLGTAAATAQKLHTKAVLDQQKAVAALANLQARLGATGGTKGATDAAAVGRAQAAEAAGAMSVTAAQTRLATAGQRLQILEAKIAAGSASGATAATQLAAARAAVQSASTAMTAAESRAALASGRVAIAQGKQAAAGQLTVAQSQQLAAAQAKVSAANALAASTGVTAAASSKDLGKENVTGGQILDMLNAKTKGLAQSQANTFGGEMRRAKATIEDFGATFGAKFGKPLIAAGPLIAGLGGILESGFIGKIGRAGKSAIGFGKSVAGIGATVASGVKYWVSTGASAAASWIASVGSMIATGVAWAASTIAAGVSAAASWVLSMASMMAASIAAGAATVLAWLPVIAPIAALIAIGYLVYRNWGTISAGLATVWHAIQGAAASAFGFIKHIFSDVISDAKRFGPLVLAGVLPIVGIPLLIIQHWSAVSGFFKALPGTIVGFFAGAASWLLNAGKDVITGLWNGVWGAMAWLGQQEIKIGGKVIGFLGDAGKWLLHVGEDIVKGLVKGIEGMAKAPVKALGSIAGKMKDAVTHPWKILSPSKTAAEFGTNIVLGLAGGVDATGPQGVAAMTRLSAGMQGALRTPLLGPSLVNPGGTPTRLGAPTAGTQHLYQVAVIQKPTIYAANLADLTKQMSVAQQRANFSGTGVTSGGLPAGLGDFL